MITALALTTFMTAVSYGIVWWEKRSFDRHVKQALEVIR